MAFTGNTTETISETAKVELPSTESTDSKAHSLSDPADGDTFRVGQTWYEVHNDTTGTGEVGLSLANQTTPSALVVQPEDDAGNEHSYSVGTSRSNSETNVDDGVYSGSTRDTQTLDSDDKVTAGYDMYGAYTEYDSDDQGSYMLNVPDGQAVAGAAFTGEGGDVSAGGSGGSVSSMSPTGWDDHAALDSDSNVGSLKQNSNLVLVGGPAVNNLVAELASDNETWTGSDYSQGDQLLHHIPDAFSSGNDALVVAGYSGSDTREAANYLANYEDHADELAGQEQLNLATP
jgi:hypothetical protein